MTIHSRSGLIPKAAGIRIATEFPDLKLFAVYSWPIASSVYAHGVYMLTRADKAEPQAPPGIATA